MRRILLIVVVGLALGGCHKRDVNRLNTVEKPMRIDVEPA